tara:strand:+ start:1330 stop:2319 length:990 start_codon:yes stop_codon:yes gene_type:complete
MPRARGDKEYVLPHKGLNTEANLLHFPIEFSPDLNNMELDFNPQMVRPRKGISSSGLARLVNTFTTGSNDVAITSFLWEGVGNDPTLNFAVVQVGEYLYFLDVDLLEDPNQAINANRYGLTGSLSNSGVKSTTAILRTQRVDMANVKGNLMVTAESINPTIISWDTVNLWIEPVVIGLKTRDMLGIEDGLGVDEHPVTPLSDDHKYNLFNQGWYKQRRDTAGSATEIDPIDNYFNNSGASPLVYPSNADIPWIAMVEDQGDLIFDPEWLRDQTFGSSPAARGHYIVDPFNIDRAAILLAPDVSGAYTGSSSGDINVVGGSIIVGPLPLP